jgi:hypothetical protein
VFLADEKPIRAIYPGPSGELWAGMQGRALRRDENGEWLAEEGFGNSEVVAFCRTPFRGSLAGRAQRAVSAARR